MPAPSRWPRRRGSKSRHEDSERAPSVRSEFLRRHEVAPAKKAEEEVVLPPPGDCASGGRAEARLAAVRHRRRKRRRTPELRPQTKASLRARAGASRIRRVTSEQATAVRDQATSKPFTPQAYLPKIRGSAGAQAVVGANLARALGGAESRHRARSPARQCDPAFRGEEEPRHRSRSPRSLVAAMASKADIVAGLLRALSSLSEEQLTLVGGSVIGELAGRAARASAVPGHRASARGHTRLRSEDGV